jgi:hypothetical protein
MQCVCGRDVLVSRRGGGLSPLEMVGLVVVVGVVAGVVLAPAITGAGAGGALVGAGAKLLTSSLGGTSSR